MRILNARNLLLLLLALLGSGAIFGGGGVLIISPSGKLFGMPLSLLDKSPFHDFLVPGILLFVVLGILPIVLLLALIKKPLSPFPQFFNCYKDVYWACTYCIYIAFALIVWIQTEMSFLHAVHWSHSLFKGLAIAIIFVALLPRVRSYLKCRDSMQTQLSKTTFILSH